MRLDFSRLPLTNRAFSERPMTFCDPQSISVLSAVIELIAIETGDRKARERWQTAQFRNLLKHAAAKSAFWRKRIGAQHVNKLDLSSLPVLTRILLREQVTNEGSLIPANPIDIHKHATSGSTGMPVEFFISQMNAQYNQVRSTAQYFLEGRDLSLNRVRLRPKPMSLKEGFSVQRSGSWLGSLESFMRSGANRYIEFFHPDWNLLRKELERESIGYLVAPAGCIEAILQHFGPEFFERARVAMWIPFGEPADQNVRKTFASLGIPIRSNYSSEEVGMMGSECEKVPNHYHVATSNVIIEVDDNERMEVEGTRVGRVLVTHLHSYATPFIRYDIGDVAALADRCACGHGGPTLSNVFGRSKSLVKHADGRVSTFYVRTKDLRDIAKFDEYRIRQADVKRIVVEIGSQTPLAAGEQEGVTELIRGQAGKEFEVELKVVAKIDWGHSLKRLAYHSDVM